jgi:hypothetical protein
MSIGVFIDEKNNSEIHGVNQSGAATYCISTDFVSYLGIKAQERRVGLTTVAMDKQVSILPYESGIYRL